MKAFPRFCASLWLAASLGASALTPAQIEPPASLAATPALPVSGRVGWRPQRELRFGPYATHELRRRSEQQRQSCPEGCSKTELGLYRHRFDEAFQTTTRRVSFALGTATGAEIEVAFTDQIDQHRVNWMTEWLGVQVEHRRTTIEHVSLMGKVRPLDAPSGWRFVVWDEGNGPFQGWAEDDAGQRLLLRPLQRVMGGGRSAALNVPGLVLGYAFELDGRAVAAVATEGPGQVWLAEDLPEPMRHALAGMAAALLLRQAHR